MEDPKYTLQEPEIKARLEKFIRQKKRGTGYVILEIQDALPGINSHAEVNSNPEAHKTDRFHDISCYCALAALRRMDTDFKLFSNVVSNFRSCLKGYTEETQRLIKVITVRFYLEHGLKRPQKWGETPFSFTCKSFLGEKLYNEFRHEAGWNDLSWMNNYRAYD